MHAVVERRRRPPALLMRAVWLVLRADRVARRIVAVGLLARLAIAAALPTAVWTVGDGSDPGASVATLVGVGLLLAWMAAGVVTKVALLRALDARRVGARRTARRCLAEALRRGPAVAGLVLARRRRPDDSWSPGTAFVVPIVATTDGGLAAARRRSVELHRERWGAADDVEAGTPALIGAAGLLASLVVAFPAIAVTGAVSIVGQLIALTLLVAGLTAATLARALIAYAAFREAVGGEGEVPFGLTSEQLAELVGPR